MWMRALNVGVMSWTEWRCIDDAFGGNDEMLEMFLAGMVVMNSGVKVSRVLGCWSI